MEDHGTSDKAGTLYVTMVPRQRKQIKENLAKLDLMDRIEVAAARPKMKMTFANGDAKTMAFEDAVLNVPIEPGTFSLGG